MATSRAARVRAPRTTRRRLLLGAIVVVIVIYLLAPTAIVIPLSVSTTQTMRFPPQGFTLAWYGKMLTDESWSAHLVTSIQVGLGTALMATVIGTSAAVGIVRGRFPGKQLISGLIVAPQIVPLVIIAIGMYGFFTSLRITGSYVALVAAHTVLALPFVVVNVAASLTTVDPNLELAARSLGAGRWAAFSRITMRLITPGIAAGAIFAFITSWDDVVVALFLTTPQFRTLPVEMWQQLRQQIDPTVAAVSSTLLIVTTVLFALVLFMRRPRPAR